MDRNQTLENIKTQLITIRDSQALKDVEADSDVAKGLAGVFGGVSDVLKQNSNGIASSSGARNAVTNGEAVVNTKGNSALDAMSKLQQENQKLQKAFEAEKATREGLEADKSIGDQKTNQELMDIIASLQSGGTGGAAAGGTETAGATAGSSADGATTAPAAGTVEGGINVEGDPVAQALSEDYTNQQAIVNQQLEALAAFVDAEDADVQSSLKNIQATAELQAKRVAKENERLAQASQVAGIVSGRGMYSPYEHEGIVSEVIQDGLDRITQIELTAQEAKLEAKKAHREFRYEAFVQSTEMVSALSELKRQTIVDIGKRLQEVEAAEREKMTFDQEQQDRTSFILAAELVNATPEEIRAAALANGVNAGALMRTVADYKQEQEMNDLDRQATEESILSSQQSRRLAQARFDNEQADRAAAADKTDDEVKPMSADTIKKFTELYNLGDVDSDQTVSAIPPYWSEEDLMAFMQENPETDPTELKSEMKIWEAKQIVNQLPEDQREGFIEASLQEEGRDYPTVNQKVKNLVTGDHKKFIAAAKNAGITDWYDWFALKDEVKTWINTPAAEAEIQRLYDLGYSPTKIQQELLALYGKE